MTIDEQIEEEKARDLQQARRLRIGCPVYGNSFNLLKMKQAQLTTTAALALVPYGGGYLDPQTGRFSPVQRYTPAPR